VGGPPAGDPASVGLGRALGTVAPRRYVRRGRRRALLLALAGLVLAFLAAGWAARRAAAPHPALATMGTPPLVIAHQGGNMLWPPNTRRAFDGAVAVGSDALEMDVHRTSDGELVVIHDDTVDRTTDGEGALADLAYEEVAALEAGDAWSPPGSPATPFAGAGLRVPRLAEVLADHPDVPLAIEIKPEGAPAAVALCARLRAEGRTADTVISSFHADAMRAFRDACPEVATAAIESEVRLFLALARLRLAGPYRPPFDALQVPVRSGGIEVVTPAFVRAARAKDVPVHAWTVNDPAEMERLYDLGVSGLITDRPDLALRAAGRAPNAEALPPYIAPD
jgi:glycerophosphoryl diester phosphodiesterase